MYVSGRVDIFDMVDINLFIVVALNMMVLKLGYTGKSEFMFYNYLRPLTSLDEGLYALACEEDVRFLVTFVRSFKLIEVYIEYGVTGLDSYLRAPWFRATLKEITDDPEISTEVPIVEEFGTQEFSVEDVLLEEVLILRRKEERSLINTSFLNEYECSSLALD
nr:hypothetical protein [Tanacetum cinerariifolium]